MYTTSYFIIRTVKQELFDCFFIPKIRTCRAATVEEHFSVSSTNKNSQFTVPGEENRSSKQAAVKRRRGVSEVFSVVFSRFPLNYYLSLCARFLLSSLHSSFGTTINCWYEYYTHIYVYMICYRKFI